MWPSPPVPEGGRYRDCLQERQTPTEQTLVQKVLGTQFLGDFIPVYKHIRTKGHTGSVWLAVDSMS